MAYSLSRSVIRSLCNPRFFSSEASSLRSLSSLQSSSPAAVNASSGLPLSTRDLTSTPYSSTLCSRSISESSIAVPFLCGRGDKKTKKGKRFRGKFGNPRPNREHRIRRIRERWEQPPGTPWPVPGLSVEDYRPIF